ncbi:MAG: tRNA U-34 5-methylaminomethyl-2-thiouridine biosynthesis protein, partial [Pseudomonadota bacterium]
MHGAPRSKEYDDVYFSADDGLAETQHVFLDGNNLPGAWAGKERFVICETGFGTGLNFLAVWKLFEDTAPPEQSLDFISFEKFPLTAQEIEEYLSPWAESFGG